MAKFNLRLVGGKLIVNGVEAESAEAAMSKYLTWFSPFSRPDRKDATRAVFKMGPYAGETVEVVPA